MNAGTLINALRPRATQTIPCKINGTVSGRVYNAAIATIQTNGIVFITFPNLNTRYGNNSYGAVYIEIGRAHV